MERIWLLFQKEFHCIKGFGRIGDKDIEMTYPNDVSEGCILISDTEDHIKIVLKESADAYGRYCIYGISFEFC